MTEKSKSKGGRATPSPGGRNLAVRVKTAKSRDLSSTLWLERQLNDPYVAEAKRLGYRSRAAFKLAQLDDKYRLLRPGMRIVDLGAAPGGWTQIAVERTARGLSHWIFCRSIRFRPPRCCISIFWTRARPRS
jgi:23S rRNA (uridine2552-2'-O)-methyltransferase